MTERLDAPAGVARDPDLYRGWATIRCNWDRFYKEFPGLYDRFAVSTPLLTDEMQRIADFSGSRVLSLASGTGKDAFEIARRAEHVTGIEPWIEMRSFAIAKQERLGITNVDFVDGVAENLLRFADASFDRVVSAHGAPFPWDGDDFVKQCLRVVRPGGYVLFGGTAGSATARELGATDPPRPEAQATINLLERHSFQTHARLVELDFGSVEEALATWGFIYGEAAIDYLLANPTYALEVNMVVHYRQTQPGTT